MHSIIVGLGSGLLIYGVMSMLVGFIERVEYDREIPAFGWFRFILALGLGILISLS